MRQSAWLLLAAAAIPAGYVSAGAAQVSEGVRACMIENDDARRLACYDRELNRHAAKDSVATTVATPPAKPAAVSASTTSASTAVNTASPDGFGVRGSEVARQRDQQQRRDNPGGEQLTAKVTAISQQPRGELVMTLENGQVWQQKQSGSYFPLKVGDRISIASGALGSYRLSAPSGRSTAVSRIR